MRSFMIAGLSSSGIGRSLSLTSVVGSTSGGALSITGGVGISALGGSNAIVTGVGTDKRFRLYE